MFTVCVVYLIATRWCAMYTVVTSSVVGQMSQLCFPKCSFLQSTKKTRRVTPKYVQIYVCKSAYSKNTFIIINVERFSLPYRTYFGFCVLFVALFQLVNPVSFLQLVKTVLCLSLIHIFAVCYVNKIKFLLSKK